jgi:putative ABC transport system permease protein
MLRHFFIATLRSLSATRLQSAIAILGLAVGLWVAIMDGLLVFNQYTYDSFIPDADQLYQVLISNQNWVTGARYGTDTPHELAALLKEKFPQVRDATRYDGNHIRLRHGEVDDKEVIYWADPNFFRLMPMPVLYGDPNAALARPDGIVLPLSVARKYFRRDDAVGQTIEIDRKHAMTVLAVIADLPSNASNFESAIFASGRASFSSITQADARPPMGTNGQFSFDVSTVLRLSPGTDAAQVQSSVTTLVQAHLRQVHVQVGVKLVRRDRLHISPDLMPRVPASIKILSAMSLLVLVLACLNFVNLSTARVGRRAVEVGIRKACGASRTMLAVQFLGEGVVQALFALCVAMMLVELSLPWVNSFTQGGAVFDYWRNPVLLLTLIGGAVVVGALSGIYPALVLSSLRPVTVLKGLQAGSVKAGLIRQALVGLQFVILIVEMSASAIFLMQNHYALHEALRIDSNQMLFVRDQKCDSPFEAVVRALPGVLGEACSSVAVLPELAQASGVRRHAGGGTFALNEVSIGYGLFELYGLKPAAGRFFSRAHPGDAIPADPPPAMMANYVINQTAAKRLGYASPEAAVGKALIFDQPPLGPESARPKPPPTDFVSGFHMTGPRQPRRSVLDGVIVGVVPDFSLYPSDSRILPIAYSVGWPLLDPVPKSTLVHVKLIGRDIPETLDAIDAMWRKTGGQEPAERSFLDAYTQEFVLNTKRQGQIFGFFAGMAALLACLGLFALSIATAERRTKEIGIRKAMGASSGDIVRLLLWQFLKPVLWAALVAVPLAWALMQRWLSDYPYHVVPGPWPYLVIAAFAVVMGLVTVVTHAILTARAVPATALRYE